MPPPPPDILPFSLVGVFPVFLFPVGGVGWGGGVYTEDLMAIVCNLHCMIILNCTINNSVMR